MLDELIDLVKAYSENKNPTVQRMVRKITTDCGEIHVPISNYKKWNPKTKRLVKKLESKQSGSGPKNPGKLSKLISWLKGKIKMKPSTIMITILELSGILNKMMGKGMYATIAGQGVSLPGGAIMKKSARRYRRANKLEMKGKKKKAARVRKNANPDLIRKRKMKRERVAGDVGLALLPAIATVAGGPELGLLAATGTIAGLRARKRKREKKKGKGVKLAGGSVKLAGQGMGKGVKLAGQGMGKGVKLAGGAVMKKSARRYRRAARLERKGKKKKAARVRRNANPDLIRKRKKKREALARDFALGVAPVIAEFVGGPAAALAAGAAVAGIEAGIKNKKKGSGMHGMGKRKALGSKIEVYNGIAHHTGGGLQKKDLMKNKKGKVVSKKMHKRGKQLEHFLIKKHHVKKRRK